MKRDRSDIESAKVLLPLPELLRKLGFTPPAGVDGGNMSSPFAVGKRQKSPSFSIFCRGGSWGWCDRSGGSESKGDEITLLERFLGLSRGDAVRRFLELAGVEAGMGAGESASRPFRVSPASDAAEPAADWPGAVAKFTPVHVAKLAKWRGYSPTFVEKLRDAGLVGLVKGMLALPVHDASGAVIAAHIRPESGRWFYSPKGAGTHPLIVGDPGTTRATCVFESQWDMLSAMEGLRWHEGQSGIAFLCTRGASNGRFAGLAGRNVFAFPQNDGPGLKWLEAVAECAPGEVRAVEIPVVHKDLNDWHKSGDMALQAAIESGRLVPRRAGPAPGPDAPPASVHAPLDTSAVLDELGIYWVGGTGTYFLRRDVAGRVRFVEMGAAEVRRKLRVLGHRAKADPESGDPVSPIDRLLDAVTDTRDVDFAINIGGTAAGVYDLPGGRVLVRESPRLIVPVPGPMPIIEAFLRGLLAYDSVLHFMAWLKVGYEALRAGQRRPGQALVLVGPPDCGKSRIQHQLITPSLAGRHADPKSFFFGRTDFNSELIGAEHLLIEEVPSSNRHEDRTFFGERIKEVVANDTTRLHKKNQDAVTVEPFWRLSITLNDNPEKLRCLPPMTDDLAEKMIMLQARPAPEFWERFADAEDPRLAFREGVAREMPAFAAELLAFVIPQSLAGRRYGVRSGIPEDIAQTLFEAEPEHHLLMLIDKDLFPADRIGGAEPWRGDAEDLKQRLSGDTSEVRASAVRLLGAYPTACGQYLARLAAKFPTRFRRERTASKRGWCIHPPAS